MSNLDSFTCVVRINLYVVKLTARVPARPCFNQGFLTRAASYTVYILFFALEIDLLHAWSLPQMQ